MKNDELGMKAEEFSNLLIEMISKWRDALPSVEDFEPEPAELLKSCSYEGTCARITKCKECKWYKFKEPKPLIDEREEKFNDWWNDNLSLQPPLIDPSDSPSMIAKKFSRIGFFGCYDLQEAQNEH